MTVLVPLALLGWIPVVVAMFFLLPPRFATGLAYAAGWCFLPVAGYNLPAFPDYDKMFATSVGAVLGLLLTDPTVLSKFRPRLIDIPAVIWCLCPMASSLTNGLGAYDGLSAIAGNVISWGIPYFIGRCVYRRLDDLMPLMVSILVCGLLYVPLCLWEIRMSPQLHRQLYGFHQHNFGQTMRFGGFRPTVFMNHGLQVALWMASCFLILLTTRFGARLRVWRGQQLGLYVIVFGVTVVLMKSLGAWALVAMAAAAVIYAANRHAVWPLIALTLIAPVYMTTRMTGYFSGDVIVSNVERLVNKDRAGSMQTRLTNEDQLMQKARQKVLFGWGGWGRNRITNDRGENVSITDGLWIIVYGINGLVGLISLYMMLLWGPFRVFRYSRPDLWQDCWLLAAAVGLACGVVLNVIDSVPNAMVVPVFVLVTGALASVSLGMRDEIEDLEWELDQADAQQELHSIDETTSQPALVHA